MDGVTHCQMCKLAKDKNGTTYVIRAICATLDVSVKYIFDFETNKH